MTGPGGSGYGGPDHLFDLLPVVVRQLDATRGHPLRDLLRVISEQVAVVEDGITALGEEPFIETCGDWSVPYLGDLVGWTPVAEAGLAALGGADRDLLRSSVLVPRRDVANTIRHRRRKGTLALLEELAHDVTGWPARAVESYRLLGVAPHVEHVRAERGHRVDVRRHEDLQRLGGPFETTAHTVDVRRRYNLPDVAVFVWRLGVTSMTSAPAAQTEHVDGPSAFTFDSLYHDVPLFVAPADTSRPVSEADVPTPLTRRMLEYRDAPGAPGRPMASPLYYGPGRSFTITAHDWPEPGTTTEIPAEQIRPADLSDWRRYQARLNTVAVDPELGRMLFHFDQIPDAVTVSYHYGFPADLGGGEYDRVVPEPIVRPTSEVFTAEAATAAELEDALTRWRDAAPRYAVIDLTRTALYDAPVRLALAAGQELVLRAANRTRPIIWLPDRRPDRADSLGATLGPGSRLVLDGLTLAGRAVRLGGVAGADGAEPPCAPTRVTIRHCTLVPGRIPAVEGDRDPPPPSLELADLGGAVVQVTHSVVGPVSVSDRRGDTLTLRVADSVVDAVAPVHEAVGRPGPGVPPVVLTLVRSTVRGAVLVHAVDLIENAILDGEIGVARRRSGCVRFSWIPPGSCTPRRFRCQPELAVAALGEGTLPEAVERVRARLRPRFTTTAYGGPGYLQLAPGIAEEIRRGADDDSEMGVYHDLHHPARQANLRARLLEYTPADMSADLIIVT